jgi:hypothetical protein
MKGARKGLSRGLLCPSWPSAPTGQMNPRQRAKRWIGGNFGEWYQKSSISYHSPHSPLIGSRHMNQTSLPSGNHYPLTFQPQAAYRFNSTQSGGIKKPSNSRKWRRRTEEMSQFVNIELNSLIARLREAEQIGQTGGMNYSNYFSTSGGPRRAFGTSRLFGKGIFRRLRALARFLPKITTCANTLTTHPLGGHYSVTTLGAIC